MINSVNYSNRKGIYKDLYREIDSDNKKRKASQSKKPRKGIYVELYKQLNFKNNDNSHEQNNLYALAFKKMIKDLSSRISYFFLAATSEVKMLILAYIVVKKPVNSYIKNNLQFYSNQEQNSCSNSGVY